MPSLKIIGLGTMLALASTAAWAFQEQGGNAPGAKVPPAAATTAGPTAAPLSNLPASAGKSEGIDIRIPGLGSLGVLPKMDFGLELLYGAADLKANDENRAMPSNTDDLAIKGTLRRKF